MVKWCTNKLVARLTPPTLQPTRNSQIQKLKPQTNLNQETRTMPIKMRKHRFLHHQTPLNHTINKVIISKNHNNLITILKWRAVVAKSAWKLFLVWTKHAYAKCPLNSGEPRCRLLAVKSVVASGATQSIYVKGKGSRLFRKLRTIILITGPGRAEESLILMRMSLIKMSIYRPEFN